MWNISDIKGFKPRITKYRRSENSKQRGSGCLVIEVHPTGVKHFYFQYFRNSRRVMVSIGKYKSTPADQGISLGEAREISNNYGALLIREYNSQLNPCSNLNSGIVIGGRSSIQTRNDLNNNQ